MREEIEDFFTNPRTYVIEWGLILGLVLVIALAFYGVTRGAHEAQRALPPAPTAFTQAQSPAGR